MSTVTSPDDDRSFALDGARLVERETGVISKSFIIVGAIAALIGLLIIFFPGRTAMVVTVLLAISMFAGAAGNLAIATRKSAAKKARIIAGILAVVFAVAAVICLVNLQAATVGLAFWVGLFVGISWLLDGIYTLISIGDAPSKVWAVITGLLSIIAGIVVILSPVWGATVIWLVIGISLLIFGIAQVVRGIRFGRRV